MYLQELLGFSRPEYGHIPLLVAPDGRRLSKRDKDLDLDTLRLHKKPEEIIGALAYSSGLIDRDVSISAKELTGEFSWEKLKKDNIQLQMSSFTY